MRIFVSIMAVVGIIGLLRGGGIAETVYVATALCWFLWYQRAGRPDAVMGPIQVWVGLTALISGAIGVCDIYVGRWSGLPPGITPVFVVAMVLGAWLAHRGDRLARREAEADASQIEGS